MFLSQESMEEYIYERIAYLAQKYPVRRPWCCTPVNIYYRNYRFRKSWCGRSIVYVCALMGFLSLVGIILALITLHEDYMKQRVYIGTGICMGLAIIILMTYQFVFMHYAFNDAIRIFIEIYALPMWFIEFAEPHEEIKRGDKLLLQTIISYYFDKRPIQDRLYWAEKAQRVYESTPSV